MEFHRKFPEAIGLWGLHGILQPSLVVGILVITQGSGMLVVLTDWMKGKKYVWTLTLGPCFTLTDPGLETKSTFTLVWLGCGTKCQRILRNSSVGKAVITFSFSRGSLMIRSISLNRILML